MEKIEIPIQFVYKRIVFYPIFAGMLQLACRTCVKPPVNILVIAWHTLLVKSLTLQPASMKNLLLLTALHMVFSLRQ